MPLHDMIKVFAQMQKTDTKPIGPNCPGPITPGEAKVKALPEAGVSVPLRLLEVIDEVEKKLKSLAKV